MLSMEWNDEVYRRVLLEEGRKEGKEEGRVESAIEIARNMKYEGSEITFIMKVTGLTENEIDAL